MPNNGSQDAAPMCPMDMATDKRLAGPEAQVMTAQQPAMAVMDDIRMRRTTQTTA